MKAWIYEIRLEGCLGPKLSQVFQELEVHCEGEETVLVGAVQDQAALQGILTRAFNLGIAIVAVNRKAEV